MENILSTLSVFGVMLGILLGIMWEDSAGSTIRGIKNGCSYWGILGRVGIHSCPIDE